MVSKFGKTLNLLILLIIIGACVVGGYEALAAPENQTPVTFPDPNLETAIREALNKPGGAIYTSELESLTELTAVNDGISDLTGLEYCTGLNRLYLGDNQISDISPLAGLTNLQKLSLYNNQISDISPLAGLTNLQKLYLHDNQISDISPLDGLTKLWELYLTRNQISDISPLSSLTNLGRLNLKDNQIADISPLVGLTKLEMLYLNNNEISDISPLAGLTNLKILFLENNQINDILPLVENSGLSVGDDVVLRNNPLSTDSLEVYIPQLEQRGVKVKPVPTPKLKLTGEIFPDPNLETAIRKALNKLEGAIYTSDLESLTWLEAHSITDLTGLEHCTSLTWLGLTDNQISDISPLAGLTNLQNLNLNINQISDISPLAGLTNLQSLGLSKNQISDISPLAGLTNLQSLSLQYNRISDISPLAGLTNLRELYLWSNLISDLSSLAGLNNLQKLSLYNNQISDVSPLGGLTNLQELHLSYNQISDISPLAGLTNLQKLRLYNNQISDISPLAGLTSLQKLYLWQNQISDVSPLGGLTALNHVNLTDNPLSSASANIYIPLLRIKGVPVRSNSPLIILNTIMFIALALVAIRIGITKRRMASWGWVRRALQLSLITIVCGLAYYLACTGSLHYVAFPISIFLVSLGAVVAFWSYRSRVSDLVGWALIALAPVSFFAVFDLVWHFTDPYSAPFWFFVGPPSASILAAAGVLFLQRRVRLRRAIIHSALVLLVGSIAFFLALMMSF